jgi:hypothetical protein
MYMIVNYEPIVGDPYGDSGTGDFATGAIRNHYSVASRAFMIWAAGPDQADSSLYWAGFNSGPAYAAPFFNLV